MESTDQSLHSYDYKSVAGYDPPTSSNMIWGNEPEAPAPELESAKCSSLAFL